MSFSILNPSFAEKENDWVDEYGEEFIAVQPNDGPKIIEKNFKLEEFSSGLLYPTTMTFVDNGILVLQKHDGMVKFIDFDGNISENIVLDVNVANSAEYGMLGIESNDAFVYMFFTESTKDGGNPIANNVYKYTWSGDSLDDPILLKSFPAVSNIHNSGVLTVGLDGTVYALMGDQFGKTGVNVLQNQFGEPNDTGVIIPIDPPGPYYSIGIRNSFGLTVDPSTGFLWDTENGVERYDEINLVEKWSNSGWKAVQGPIELSRITFIPTPDFAGVWKSHIMLFLANIFGSFFLSNHYEYSDPEFSWRESAAPTALVFSDNEFGELKNQLFVGDCKNGYMYKFKLNNDRTKLTFDDSDLKDLVFEPDDSLDEILFARDMGCITDLEFYDGKMYVTSLTGGKIYKISSIGIESNQ